MESKLISFAIVLVCVGVAASQSASQQDRNPHQVPSVQVQPQQPSGTVLEQGPNSGKNQESTYTPYAYRSGLNGQQGNNYQTYPPATYTRDNYGTSRDATGTPLVGVSSSADFQLSAYFGQIFWAFVACSLTLVISIWVIRYCAGSDVVGGIVDKINSGATGKALDLDRLTNMVYQAFDTYGKYAAKEARHVVEATQKGR